MLTHKGSYNRVVKTFKRNYSGSAVGLILSDSKKIHWMTDEHPVLIADTKKETKWIKACDVIAGRREKETVLEIIIPMFVIQNQN